MLKVDVVGGDSWQLMLNADIVDSCHLMRIADSCQIFDVGLLMLTLRFELIKLMNLQSFNLLQLHILVGMQSIHEQRLQIRQNHCYLWRIRACWWWSVRFERFMWGKRRTDWQGNIDLLLLARIWTQLYGRVYQRIANCHYHSYRILGSSYHSCDSTCRSSWPYKSIAKWSTSYIQPSQHLWHWKNLHWKKFEFIFRYVHEGRLWIPTE